MGSLHMLEAVIVGVIMLSTVTYVVMLDAPVAQHDAVEQILKDKAHDFLHIADEWLLPAADCDGRTQLERLIIQGLNEDHAYWNQRTERFFGPGVEATLLLDNTESVYPLHEKYSFMGATYDIPIQPDWSFALPVGQTDALDGTVRTTIETAGVHYGELIRPKGDAAKITISANDRLGEQSVHAWGLSALSQGGRSQNISWSNEQGISLLHVAAIYSPITSVNEFYVAIAPPKSSELIPRNTSLVVRIPPGWNVTDDRHPAGWDAELSGNSTAGWVLDFVNVASDSPAAAFKILATPPASPVRPFDVFHARLSNGSLGESSLVVTFPSALEHSLPRAVYPTVPYPVQLGARALFGAAFANGGPAVNVTRVDIEIPGGYDILRNDGQGVELFADAPLEPTDTGDGIWSWVDARHIRWEGDRPIASGGAGSWLVGALITSDASQVTSIEPLDGAGPVSTLTFENGYEDESLSWGRSPGLVRHRVPPASSDGASDGYPLPSEVQLATHDTTDVLASMANYDATVTGGTTLSYSADAGDLTRLESALTNSSFEVTKRLAPLGSLLPVDANLDSLLTFLAAGERTGAKLEVELYAPPSLGCRPTATWTRDVTALPLSAIRASSIFDAEGAGLPSAFFTGDDGYVYRFESSGAPVWSQRLNGKGTALTSGVLGIADRAVFTGDGQGYLTRLDPISGDVVWSKLFQRAPPGLEKTPRAVTSLELDEARGLLLLATSDGVLEIRAASNGALLHRLVSSSAFKNAQWLSDGGIVAHDGDGVMRLSAELEMIAAWHSADAIAFAAGDSWILVAEPERVVALDAPTLSVTQETPLAGDAAIATSGDATGDGVNDLIVVQEDGRIMAFDGNGGGAAWEVFPVLPSTGATQAVDLFMASERIEMIASLEVEAGPGAGTRFDVEPCEGRVTLASTTYHTDVSCIRTAPDDPSGSPMVVHASRGQTTVATWQAGAAFVSHIDANGEELWTEMLEGDAPATLAHGAWGLMGDAVFMGTAQGIARVVEAETGGVVYHERATQAAGKFIFVVPVPDGGFFGTHILVAKVTWNGQGGQKQTARLSDWFQVVDKEGHPVTKPVYRAVLVVRDQDSRGNSP